ncbi:MAG: chromosomal replication initiator protein DnaA [Elusimicrobia bacterium RIFOXYA2_FULL_50_26]|nr:MAG: chromosomal replication initiator protein DnaA [Elusimicrobia bacterium RIFOXYA2_FULL_50_26]OGS23693.1 MAG: chromosomal replication initiator protein DnaA [Elusimicrobia bacterium RIFOXYB2_FULL_50_12]
MKKLRNWELSFYPSDTDSNRWRLKLKIDEKDLAVLLSSLPVKAGRPFIAEDDSFDFCLYLYEVTINEFNQVKGFLTEESPKGRVITSADKMKGGAVPFKTGSGAGQRPEKRIDSIWQLAFSPNDKDKNRWCLKINIKEEELNLLLGHMPGTKGRPFLLVNEPYTFGVYLYELKDDSFKRVKKLLEEEFLEGEILGPSKEERLDALLEKVAKGLEQVHGDDKPVKEEVCEEQAPEDKVEKEVTAEEPAVQNVVAEEKVSQDATGEKNDEVVKPEDAPPPAPKGPGRPELIILHGKEVIPDPAFGSPQPPEQAPQPPKSGFLSGWDILAAARLRKLKKQEEKNETSSPAPEEKKVKPDVDVVKEIEIVKVVEQPEPIATDEVKAAEEFTCIPPVVPEIPPIAEPEKNTEAALEPDQPAEPQAEQEPVIQVEPRQAPVPPVEPKQEPTPPPEKEIAPSQISFKNNEAPEATLQDLELNPRYIFEEFVIGPNNRFTAAAAQAVADNPGKIYNPFFIYSGVGLGKTHLMHAVGHYVHAKNPRMRILYVTTEKFMSEVIESIRHGTLQQMREHYRQIDLLLIDDIQFLVESESTQEEFFHTFNVLHQSGKQIIITSDRTPKQLTTLEDRLRSRFEWGLIADIKSPNLETRVAILKKKGAVDNMELNDNILLYIASKLKSNIRELEGFLKRINAYASLTHQAVNMELVRTLMSDLLPPGEMDDDLSQETPAAPAPKAAASVDFSRPSPPPVTYAPPEHDARAPAPAPVPPPLPSPVPPSVKIPSTTSSYSGTAADASEANLKAVEVGFFFPEGKEGDLGNVKEHFREVIKKHRLKFRLEGMFERSYPVSAKVDYAALVELCKASKVSIAIVIGPPPESGIDPEEFANLLATIMDDERISLQLVPWAELNKDYRYLNLALDITLLKHSSG